MKRHDQLIALHNRDMKKELDESRCVICHDDSTKMETVEFNRDANCMYSGKRVRMCIDCIGELFDYDSDCYTIVTEDNEAMDIVA